MVTDTILPAASKMRVFHPSMFSVAAPPNQVFCGLKWNSEARSLVFPAPSEMIIEACIAATQLVSARLQISVSWEVKGGGGNGGWH